MNSLQIQNTKYIACISNTYLKYLYLKYFTTLETSNGSEVPWLCRSAIKKLLSHAYLYRYFEVKVSTIPKPTLLCCSHQHQTSLMMLHKSTSYLALHAYFLIVKAIQNKMRNVLYTRLQISISIRRSQQTQEN